MGASEEHGPGGGAGSFRRKGRAALGGVHFDHGRLGFSSGPPPTWRSTPEPGKNLARAGEVV